MNEFSSRDFIKKKNVDWIKSRPIIKIILIPLILFFVLQFLSHIFLALWEKNPELKNAAFLKWSGLIFPIDAEPFSEYGYSLMLKYEQSPDDQVLAESISYLKKSLSNNILYYQTHFYLGGAYFFQNLKDYTSLEQAVKSYKRSARIWGNNTEVGINTMKVLLSLWPHLTEQDKNFCSELLKRSIRKIRKENFDSLLEIWGLYVRDIGFFKDLLKQNPQYYQNVAEKLLQIEIDMPKRHYFLAKYAEYLIENIQKQYRLYLSKPPADLLHRTKLLFDSLNGETVSYYILDPNNKLNQKTYFELKKRLNLNILELLFSKTGWEKDHQQLSEIESFILSYIKDAATIDDLTTLNDLLTKVKYFNLSNLKVFYIGQLIKYKSSQYDTVILETENLRKSITYITKENMADYTEILLLLSDAYISSRLLIRAGEVLAEIEKDDTNLTEIYWRTLQVEQVVGDMGDDGGKDGQKQKEKEQQYELIKNSSQILLASTPLKKTVYLIDSDVIEIQFSDWLKQRRKDFHLLQISRGGRIFYEAYLSNLKLPARIKIPSEEGKNSSTHTLTIKLL